MKFFSVFFKLLAPLLFVFSAIFLSSCVKQDFAEPTITNADPNITANKTIADLKLGVTNVPVRIDTDVVIAGVVIADDVSGNFYKSMVIQDSTGGIVVMIDVSNFNTLYPIGRNVFIKCKGLYVADDGDGNFQIGKIEANQIGRIPQTLVTQYVFAGKWGVTVEPVTYKLSDVIPTSMSNRLIRIDSVQFQPTDTAKSYADAITLTSINRVIKDCNGKQMNIYTSGYANFADSLTPTGFGAVIGIYTLYNNSGELQLRNATEVKMTKPRC